MKIVIKCDGLSVRTKDLGMGLSVLNRIASHGIMNHSFISHSLLEKASKIIEHAYEKIAALSIIKKAQENFQAPEFAPAEEAASEESKGVKELSKEEFVKRISKGLNNSWTIDEDKMICDMLHLSPSRVCENKTLRKRHSSFAIKTRMSVYKNRRFDRLGSDRAKMMQAYLSGEKVSTPVADINKHVPTPITDRIEQDVADGKYEGKRSYTTKHGKTNYLWTEDEILRMRENINLPGKKLTALFPGRTLAAVMYKRGEIKGVKRHSSPRSTIGKKSESSWTEREEQVLIDNANMRSEDIASMLIGRTRHAVLAKRHKLIKKGKIKDVNIVSINRWTQEEDDAIRLNMNMSPKNLAKLPWLKNRTSSSIAQRKFKFSKEQHES